MNRQDDYRKKAMKNLLEIIAKAYGYPTSWVKEAYLAGHNDLDDVMAYCERKEDEQNKRKND